VDVLIFLGVLRDVVVSRSVHKVYLAALPALIACHVFIMHTLATAPAWWVRIADKILG
jgi:hypothetical protein